MSAMFTETSRVAIRKAMVASQIISQMARLMPCAPRAGIAGNSKEEAKMPTSFRSGLGWVTLAALTVAIFAAPAAQATPVTHNFSVTMQDDPFLFGPAAGTTTNGSFTYDSSSVTPGAGNHAIGLLTALDFTFNGITYNASTANTGFLQFDDAGNLEGFAIGTNCDTVSCTVSPHTDGWLGDAFTFLYSTSTSDYAYQGFLTFAFAPYSPPTSVPEPGTLGLFGLGGLMMGLVVGTRRRIG